MSIEYKVQDFNGLAEKHGFRYRVAWADFNGKGEKLHLGREEQFEYQCAQCVLASDPESAKVVLDALNRFVCAEFGE